MHRRRQAMDDQHGILMDTLNELRIMLLQGADRRDICLQLERLIEFTQMHFQSEEQLLLQRQGFPGVKEHGPPTNTCLAKLYTALEQMNRKSRPASARSSSSCLPGISNTSSKLDRPYGAWLNERGVY